MPPTVAELATKRRNEAKPPRGACALRPQTLNCQKPNPQQGWADGFQTSNAQAAVRPHLGLLGNAHRISVP
jgi:hypothetical protein